MTDPYKDIRARHAAETVVRNRPAWKVRPNLMSNAEWTQREHEEVVADVTAHLAFANHAWQDVKDLLAEVDRLRTLLATCVERLHDTYNPLFGLARLLKDDEQIKALSELCESILDAINAAEDDVEPRDFRGGQAEGGVGAKKRKGMS